MEKTNKVIRLLVYSLVLFAIVALFSTSSASAQGLGFQVPNPFNRDMSLQDVIVLIINVAFIAAGLVAVIYLIIGGFRYVTSGGNAEAIEGAKATILNAIIGLIIIFISFLLVNYVLSAIGVTGTIFHPTPVSAPGGGSNVGG
jgi:hypothetical protein